MSRIRMKPLQSNANKRLPESLTLELLDQVDSLPVTGFKSQYLNSEFLSKFVSKDTDPANVRRQRAINKWLATERSNEATNVRLLTLSDEFNILPRVSWLRFRDKVCSLVTSIIGEVPPYEALIGSFSGGATTSRGRTESHPASKYLGKADVTDPARHIIENLRDEMPGWSTFWSDLEMRTVKGNILFTVPKKTDIDRCACKEPDINMFLQKGLGNSIRRALRGVGINLNDQTRNQALACEGSKFGNLATLDLSSASDSISRELVFQLLPIHWFHLLDAVRSHITVIDGEEHVNEMFSSMGNGFTFELESLLFYCVSKAVTYFEGASGVVSVYGDDIIVPTSAAEPLIWVLSVLGFETNVKKSFYRGSFRESCGGHFYCGRNVTPFYVKGPIAELSDLIHLGNSLRRWGDVEQSGFIDCDVWPLWSKIRDLIPSHLWGGRDLSSKYQLVTPHRPDKRLLPIVSRLKLGTGGYIHWLNTTWVRDTLGEEAIETSTLSTVGNVCRLRPAMKVAVGSIRSEFLEEYQAYRVNGA